MKEKIYLSPPDLRGNEQKLIQDVITSNWIAPLGPMLDLFEEKLLDSVNSTYAVALNSATSAIHLGLQVLGISKGDKVLCPTFTFVASVNPITYLGATPVFVDAEVDTWNVCPVLLEKAIKEEIKKGDKPKAMVLVHGYGTPAKLKEILAIVKKYDLLILEDAASALGATCDKKSVGTFGDVGVYSFNGNKIITTSGGGMLVSNNKKYIDKAKYLASQAKENTPDYQHNFIGYNYRLSNVLAAIGLAQLDVLPKFLEIRKQNYLYYKEALKEISITFLEPENNTESNYWLTCVLFESNILKEKVRLALEVENIESRSLWKPMHQQTIYNTASFYSNGISDDLFNRGLCLPSGSSLTEKQLDRVCQVILAQF
ncbi:dTDP-4-amino-4,6-dideoxygalactose transaminase [Wenyingzhuangia heitensis]|uniref:dTDP-4-amino-4,6-dideoxygalactose transaminase n=1 Tax=Wenyingzhuangia heitensis TaxID=1487859 RepID=A0ABX0UBC5_9FLAO|nr:aminotransferase class I/II-fold pyridoxal phosphate-dependent enzyme [Wenyingzhuangia heitensis]NIJ44372.1 dTDP-4-amino-4,6-dideoxygalactose transaminase [Wenyingzhuangia heitensis]